MPKDVQTILLEARDSKGSKLFNKPSVLKAFAQVARDLNPAGTVVSAAGGDVGKALGTEIEKIRKVMTTDIDAYNRDPKMRARYTELLNAQMSTGGRPNRAA
jgi:hypothetical protein